MNFYGPYNENVMDIAYVQPDNEAEIRADHGRRIWEEIFQYPKAQYPPFFFALILENQQTIRPVSHRQIMIVWAGYTR